MDNLRLYIRDLSMYMCMRMTVRTGDIEMYLSIGRVTDRNAVLIDFSLTLLTDILRDSRVYDSFKDWIKHSFLWIVLCEDSLYTTE